MSIPSVESRSCKTRPFRIARFALTCAWMGGVALSSLAHGQGTLVLDPQPNLSFRSRAAGFQISDVASLQNGEISVAGIFAYADNMPRAGFARLQADGALDMTFRTPEVTGFITRQIALADNRLILGGPQRIDGVIRPGLARLLADGTLDVTFNPTAPTGIHSLVDLLPTPDGGFYYAGMGNVVQVLRYTAEGQLVAGFPLISVGGGLQNAAAGPQGELALALFDGSLRVFDSAGVSVIRTLPAGFFASGVVFDPDGSLVVTGRNNGPVLIRFRPDGALDAGFSGTVPISSWSGFDVIRLAGGGYVVSAPLQGILLTPPHAVQFSASGVYQSQLVLENGSLGAATILGLQSLLDGDYIVHGRFQTANSILAPGMARIGPSGQIRDFFADLEAKGNVFGTASFAGNQRLIVGGFTETGGSAVANLAALTASDAVNVAVPLSANNVRNPLGLADGGAVVFGTFPPFVNFGTSTGMARILGNGTIDPNFLPGVTAPGYDVGVQLADQSIVIGGSFGGFVPNPVGRFLMRILPSGAVDTTFQGPALGAGFLPRISALDADSAGRIVFAGEFNAVQGVTRPGIARVLSNGVLDPAFAPTAGVVGFPELPRKLTALDDGRVYVLAVPANTFGSPQLIRFAADGSLDATFVPEIGSELVQQYVVEPEGSVIVAVGSRLVRLMETGALDPSFEASIEGGGVLSLEFDADGRLWVGGAFTEVEGEPRESLARFSSGMLRVSIQGPAELVVPRFSTVVLKADVSGATGAPTFQWHRDGRRIRGARDAQLKLRHVTPGDNGNYTVTVTVNARSASSAPVSLTVRRGRPHCD